MIKKMDIIMYFVKKLNEKVNVPKYEKKTLTKKMNRKGTNNRKLLFTNF